MRMKTVKVLDDATEVWYLIGRPEASDREMLERTGWDDQPVNLLVKILGGGGCESCISTFKGYIPYDIEEYGTISLDSTAIKLATIVRDLPFEEIPTVLDVRKY